MKTVNENFMALVFSFYFQKQSCFKQKSLNIEAFLFNYIRYLLFNLSHS